MLLGTPDRISRSLRNGFFISLVLILGTLGCSNEVNNTPDPLPAWSMPTQPEVFWYDDPTYANQVNNLAIGYITDYYPTFNPNIDDPRTWIVWDNVVNSGQMGVELQRIEDFLWGSPTTQQQGNPNVYLNSPFRSKTWPENVGQTGIYGSGMGTDCRKNALKFTTLIRYLGYPYTIEVVMGWNYSTNLGLIWLRFYLPTYTYYNSGYEVDTFYRGVTPFGPYLSGNPGLSSQYTVEGTFLVP